MVLTHKIPTFYNRINRLKRVAKYIKQAVDLLQLELHEGCCVVLKALFIVGGISFLSFIILYYCRIR